MTPGYEVGLPGEGSLLSRQFGLEKKQEGDGAERRQPNRSRCREGIWGMWEWVVEEVSLGGGSRRDLPRGGSFPKTKPAGLIVAATHESGKARVGAKRIAGSRAADWLLRWG